MTFLIAQKNILTFFIGKAYAQSCGFSCGYHDVGNRRGQTYEKLNKVWFFYDSLNRPIRKEYHPAGQASYAGVEYTYDNSAPGANGIGRLHEVTDKNSSGEPVCVTTFTSYDLAGRVTANSTKIGAESYTFEKTYDALGRTIGIKYPGGDTVGYAYDGEGNLARVFDQATGGNYAQFLQYNAAGQPGRITYGNAVETEVDYSPHTNRLSQITTTAPGGLTLQHFSYLYDRGGSIIDIQDLQETAASQNFTYDGLNRLETANSESYPTLTPEVDEIGNIKKGVDNPPADLTVPNRGGHTITYDYDNRVESIENAGGTTSFVYNYQGSRIKKRSGQYGSRNGVCRKTPRGGGRDQHHPHICRGQAHCLEVGGRDLLLPSGPPREPQRGNGCR
ncbi:MAG: hypothetical protein AAGU23_02030, partial [Bacillota bacterium]